MVFSLFSTFKLQRAASNTIANSIKQTVRTIITPHKAFIGSVTFICSVYPVMIPTLHEILYTQVIKHMCL